MNEIKKILTVKQKLGFFLLTVLMILNAFFEILSLNFIFLTISYFSIENFLLTDSVLLKFLKNLFSIKDISNFLILGLAISFSLKTLSQIFFYWFQSKYISRLRAELSLFYFKGYLSLPRLFYLRSNISEFVKNITSEVEYFSAAIFSISTVLMEIVILVPISIFLLATDFEISLVTIFVLVFYSILIYFFNAKIVNKLGKDRSKEINDRLKVILEFLSGNKVIKLLGVNNNFVKKFASHNDKLANIYQRTTFRNSLPKPLFELLFIFLIISFFISFNNSQTDLNTMLPILGTFIAAGYRLIPSFGRIISQLQIYKFLIPSSFKLSIDKEKFEILQKTNTEEKDFKLLEKNVSLKNISFSYRKNHKIKDNLILDNINLEIKAGEKIGIVGESGSGKSTLLDIIMGLNKPSKGQVSVDGKQLISIEKKWQNIIGCIPQDVFIADTSLKSNIAFGIDEANVDLEKIEKSLATANLNTFVSNLRFGINTLLGQNGERTSGGQKQRIGIARAVYNNPDILILDEATSSLDSSNEKQIIEDIFSKFKNKTIIMVSHKLENLKFCNSIYKIKDKNLSKITINA